jgi:hypothetical protein
MKINLHKSSILDINVDDSFSEGMAGLLRCRKDTLSPSNTLDCLVRKFVLKT